MNAAYAYFGSTHKMYDRMHVQACHQNCSSSCMGVGAGVCVYIYTHIICIYIYTHTCMSATSLQELGLRHLSTYEHVLKTTRVPSNEARKNTCAIYPKTVHA